MKRCRLAVTRLVASIVAASLTACGGGGDVPSGSVVNYPGGPGQPPTKLVPVDVTVTVPSAASRQNIRPSYVSVNTQSLVIQLSSVNGQGVTGVNPTLMNTVAHAHGCKVSAGQTICSATASGSPGSDIFAVTTYDGTSANGAVLSTGTVSAKIGAKRNLQINNQVSLALGGIITSLKLALSPSGAKRGKPATSDVTLAAFDPSGAQIVGASDFAAPVTLAVQGDTSNAFTLRAGGKSGASLSILKPTSGLTLHYDGNAQASSVTIAATVSGLGSVGANSPFVLHGKTPPPPVGTIYALNFGANGGQSAWVTEYSGKVKGNAAPERTLLLDSKLYARSIAVDSSGNLYVGYLDNSLGYSTGTHQPDTGNEIAIYAPGANGNAQPKAVLTADSKTSTALFPIFIAIDPSGRLVTYGATTVDGNIGDAVLTYSAGSSGAAAPQYGFDFVPPSLYYPGPIGLAIDTANNVYFNGGLFEGFTYSYGIYVAAAKDIGNPQAPPARTIPWDSTTQLGPGFTTNVSLNQTGEIFIGATANQGSGSHAMCQALVKVYSAGAGGGKTDVPPVRTLTLGDVSQGSGCSSNPLIAYFPTIQLYGSALFVVDPLNNALDEFASSASGNVNPTLRILGAATHLAAPVALVVTSISGPAQAGAVTTP